MRFVTAMICFVAAVMIARAQNLTGEEMAGCKGARRIGQSLDVVMPSLSPAERTKRAAVAGQIRGFLWDHWKAGNSACAVVRDVNLEGDDVKSVYVIERDTKGGVSVHGIRTFHFYGARAEARKYLKTDFSSSSLRRIVRDAGREYAVSDDESRSPMEYSLVFVDESGREITRE